jgi:Bacterial self-protective colicin-like immunity
MGSTSMSRIANNEQYLFLMNSFLNEMLPYQEFEKKYFDLWRQDRDEEWQIVQSSGERADLALITALDNGEITKEQFESQWRKLFRYENEKKKRLGEILNNVFTSLDVCVTEPENTWEIDEEELRRIVEQAVKDIEALRISEADDY